MGVILPGVARMGSWILNLDLDPMREASMNWIPKKVISSMLAAYSGNGLLLLRSSVSARTVCNPCLMQ
jgi:hypothetical protein